MIEKKKNTVFSGLEGRDQARLDSFEIKKMMAVQRERLVSLLSSNGLDLAEYLNCEDIVLSSINGFCYEQFTMYPLCDVQKAVSGLPWLINKENTVIYNHAKWTAEIDRKRFPMNGDPISIDFSFYAQYIDLLQRTARELNANPDLYSSYITKVSFPPHSNQRKINHKPLTNQK